MSDPADQVCGTSFIYASVLRFGGAAHLSALLLEERDKTDVCEGKLGSHCVSPSHGSRHIERRHIAGGECPWPCESPHWWPAVGPR
jgi:hypothetical protein